MARNSEDVASAILAVNEIVAAQTEALSNVKSVLASKTADMTLGLTGASIGDMIKIKSVDTDGKPTEWEILGSSDVEFTANRVTTIDENSDDEHYPSAGAVYDAIESAGGTFMVTVTQTDDVYSADKTFAEIKAAINSGLSVIARYSYFVYCPLIINDSAVFFGFTCHYGEDISTIRMISCTSANEWDVGEIYLEQTSNKITTLSADSTDTQYPSAKAVYDSLPTLKTWTANDVTTEGETT